MPKDFDKIVVKFLLTHREGTCSKSTTKGTRKASVDVVQGSLMLLLSIYLLTGIC